jgi:hypothetical protein
VPAIDEDRYRPGVRIAAAAVLIASACKGNEAPVAAATWPEADALFHADPRWLGADGAYSVDLGSGRSLWLFGDTYLARHPGDTRADALFLRNSVAVQTGRDPSSALMEFYWGVDASGSPQSFLAQQGTDWFWPSGGARLGSAILLFWSRVQRSSGGSGFTQYAWRAFLVANPDDPPTAWSFTDATPPADNKDVAFFGAVMADGAFIYGFGELSRGIHDLVVARWPVASAASGDLSSPDWWCGGSWATDCTPSIVVHQGAPELSVQPDGTLAPYVMIQSEGYGASTLALRTAPAPEGPWSEATSFFRPPESVSEGAFVYAGKAHPELSGAPIVATYVPTNFGPTPESGDLYRPHFVRIGYRGQ